MHSIRNNQRRIKWNIYVQLTNNELLQLKSWSVCIAFNADEHLNWTKNRKIIDIQCIPMSESVRPSSKYGKVQLISWEKRQVEKYNKYLHSRSDKNKCFLVALETSADKCREKYTSNAMPCSAIGARQKTANHHHHLPPPPSLKLTLSP